MTMRRAIWSPTASAGVRFVARLLDLASGGPQKTPHQELDRARLISERSEKGGLEGTIAAPLLGIPSPRWPPTGFSGPRIARSSQTTREVRVDFQRCLRPAGGVPSRTSKRTNVRKSLGIKLLSLEVARHHHLENTG